ncbi:MAG TPA: hypothetical protein VIJ15_09655 [Dermatophilaceae bacterium]
MTDSTTHFRSVLRGYDPAQVDQRFHELAQAAAAARQDAAERTIAVSKLQTAQDQLKNEIERHIQRARALEEEQRKASAPTYATLGDRIGSMLTLADQEAGELRARAQADAAHHHALADQSAEATRQDADHYATEMRSGAEAEAAQFMEEARRQADSLLDDADREAMARREEAEAVYERSRAKAATAAVDFETTLAARRDSSALEFAAEVTAAEKQLASVRVQSEQTRIESEQAQQEASARSAQQLEQSMTHAHSLVAEAKAKAERIRGDSERELAAATQRRDSINGQLSNVRQMLAALGGVAVGNAIDVVEAVTSKPEAAAPAAQPKSAATPSGNQPKTTPEQRPQTATVGTPAARHQKAASDEPAGDKAADKKTSPIQPVVAKG